MSSKSKGFQCRLGIGNDGVINAIVWMSSSIVSNFERFGSSICVDAMKWELNALKWLCFSVAMKMS